MAETSKSEHPEKSHSWPGRLQTAFHPLISFIASVFLGLSALLVISYPLWLGFLGYAWARHHGVTEPILFGQIA